jgi:hypothetical protein
MPPVKPAERVFTASRGYSMADTGPNGEHRKWARFTFDAGRQERNGPLVFSFATTDPKTAERLAEMAGSHGITEVTR